MYPRQPQLTGLLTHYEGPKLLPLAEVSMARTYRDIVRLCYLRRTRPHFPQLLICQEVNEQTLDGHRMRVSHLTEYLSADSSKREMPARFVNGFELAMGNRAITQWQTMRAGLHHLELMIEVQRLAA